MAQQTPDAIQHSDFVIDKQNPDHASSNSNGSRMVNTVPCPGSDSNSIAPLCFCTITEYAIARPCPVPLPTGFVVKKGSNTLDWIAAGMPQPESRTLISANRPAVRVLI